MALFHKISGIWKKSDSYVRLPSAWKEVKNFWTKTSNGWKPIWTYKWETGTWSACSSPCGGGTQSRSVICKRSDGFTKADSFCNELLNKPAASQACNEQSCVTYENTYCTSTCNNVVLSNRLTFNMDNSRGHVYIGSFTLGQTNGRDVLLTMNYDFHDIGVNIGFSAKTTKDPVVRFLPNLCTKVYRCSNVLCSPTCTGNDCNTGNCDRKSEFLYYIRFSQNANPVETRSLIQIPGSRLNNGDTIDLYIYIEDVRNYSDNKLYINGKNVQKYSYGCIM